jgi:OHCU decarboxylase
MTITLAEINTLNPEQFVAALGGLFEGPPWIVAQTWQQRPFASVQALYDALCAIMRAAPREQQIALLQAHPDLAGKAARSGTLGAASTAEQAAAGLNRLTPAELADFTRLNAAYRAEFGFPFIICARDNTKNDILAAFALRLNNTTEQEVQTALDEVEKICALRLRDLVQEEGK